MNLENMEQVDLEDSSDQKSNDDSFEIDFDDITQETVYDLRHTKKVKVSDPKIVNGEQIFTITTVFDDKTSGEQTKKVNRKYSEFQWLSKQLMKSFPGGLVPTLPKIYDVTSAVTGKSWNTQDASHIAKEISYNPNNYVTMTTYISQILEWNRFKTFIKLKEFMTNPDQIKNIPNMDSDDPIYYSKVFKFLRSQGQSLIQYALGKKEEVRWKPSIEMKGNKENLELTDERTAKEIGDLLKSAKNVIDLQVTNLTELWAKVEDFIKLIAQDKKCYDNLNKAFESISDAEKKKELKEIFVKLATTSEGLQEYQNELVAYTKNSILIGSRRLLSKYQSLQNALDRLRDLAIDVEDLNSTYHKHKDDPDQYETYKAEYEHYLNVLRRNYDGWREDAAAMQKKHSVTYTEIVNAFLKSQKMYFGSLNKQWTNTKFE